MAVFISVVSRKVLSFNWVDGAEGQEYWALYSLYILGAARATYLNQSKHYCESMNGSGMLIWSHGAWLQP